MQLGNSLFITYVASSNWIQIKTIFKTFKMMCSDIYLIFFRNIDYEVGMHDHVLKIFYFIAFKKKLKFHLRRK